MSKNLGYHLFYPSLNDNIKSTAYHKLNVVNMEINLQKDRKHSGKR